jgi:hypothetical protein
VLCRVCGRREDERDDGQKNERGGEAIDHNPITSYSPFRVPFRICRRRVHKYLVNHQKAPVQNSASRASVFTATLGL